MGFTSGYANDSIGNIGYAEVLIYKDTSIPVILINLPLENQIFSQFTPIFSLTITEANLTNFTISSLIGIIDGTGWDSLPNGQVTIRFYANDTLGKLGTALVVVIKDVQQPTPPGIPGFNPIVMLFITAIGILSISWRLKEKFP